jgi:hypothetical protein
MPHHRHKNKAPLRRLISVYQNLFFYGKVAGVTGLEPATSGVTGQRSNQLSYTP